MSWSFDLRRAVAGCAGSGSCWLSGVRDGEATGDDGGRSGWACELGPGVFGPDLSQRLRAEPAGRRSGGAVPGAAGVPDPVTGGGRSDRRPVPPVGAFVRRHQPDPDDQVRQGRAEDRGDEAVPGPAGADGPVGGGRDRVGAGVPTGRDLHHHRGPERWRAAFRLGSGGAAGHLLLLLRLGRRLRAGVRQDRHLLPVPDQGVAERA